VTDAEYQFRRAKAEGEARNAFARASSRESEPPADREEGPEKKSPRRKGLLSEIREDDLLILGLMLLLLRESEGEDPLMLMVLAALLFF
jgi:hypothetical protein